METREYRCCMCPQREINETICPKGPGKEVERQCDFVVNWKDTKGRKYKVMEDVTGAYKGRCQDNKHMGMPDGKEWSNWGSENLLIKHKKI